MPTALPKAGRTVNARTEMSKAIESLDKKLIDIAVSTPDTVQPDSSSDLMRWKTSMKMTSARVSHVINSIRARAKKRAR